MFHSARIPTAAAGAPATTPAPSVAKTDPAPTGETKLVAHEQVVVAGGPPGLDAAFHFKPDTAPEPTPAPQTAPSSQPATPPHAGGDTRTGHASIEHGRSLLESGKMLEAREALSGLLKQELGDNEQNEIRALLTRLADDTLFGRRTVAGDPLVDTYVVQPGDALVNIARNYDVPYEALMLANGIKDPGLLRAGQKLRVLHGPFHAKIYKAKFRLDVYLQDVYVRSFRVGLGSENGTPEGGWKVKNRLENPTYYPPASAGDKRIFAPDDPNNPLGEHWIGLEGVEGNAVGHEGYGIHGTIEPESIGKAVSMGCIRMHNEDVAFLYKLLQPGKSTVTILP
jgi:lipoprotein-anchoring transpeptidase ErfK/SrfK